MSAIISRFSLTPLLALLALLALPAHPANRTPVVTATSNLAFGRIVAASGGTVTISTAGVRSKTGGLVLIPGGTVSGAGFSLTEGGTGKSLTWRTITLPASATLSSGANTMTLSNFVSDPATTMVGSGRTDVKVGASLTVGANQAAGNYSGTFSVTVDYN
jgi:hypothetical protein